ncbi:Sodium-dependent dicarboxylate transporter SdcS [Rhodobacteraceae bacterium THAF1]|nr:Sodium-dependent dicarboxylate transporter SdcS [Rhodobacteraceae bacterium THAF1]
MMIGVPLASIFIVIGWLLMTNVLYRFKLDEIPGGQEMIQGEIKKLGAMSRAEKLVAAVFVGAAAFWVLPGLLSGIPELGGIDVFDDTVIAISAGVALFLLPARSGEMLMSWRDAEEGLPWGVLLLFGGGLSLAGAVASSGLDEWFGAQVSGLGSLPSILLVGSVVLIVLFLTEITSNTATAATFIPVLGGVAIGIGAEPLGLLVPAAFAATCAFMLPVGTPPNAIVFGTGNVTIGQMVRGGVVLNVVGVILITLIFQFIGPLALGL